MSSRTLLLPPLSYPPLLLIYDLACMCTILSYLPSSFFFFLKHPAPPEIYPFPLHAPLPISVAEIRAPERSAPARRRAPRCARRGPRGCARPARIPVCCRKGRPRAAYWDSRWPRASSRSEEHTSELQSPDHLVCPLLLEKKNT